MSPGDLQGNGIPPRVARAIRRGAESASDALSRWLGRDARIVVSRVRLVDLAEATEARSSEAYLLTARITAPQNTKNCAFSCGVSPGSSMLPWVELPNEKLTCLPEPFTPANGFSCNRHTKP